MRRILVTLCALALALALGAPAAAGGWAATTLDELPPAIHAGDTYQIGYTIRQHGVTPVNVEDLGGTTVIRIVAPDGAKSLSYQGVREGATGHYIAKVTFPYAGQWTWQVTQGPFAPHELGPIKVAPALGAVSQGAPAPAVSPAQQPAGPDPFAIVALLVGIAAALVLGNRLATSSARRSNA